MVLRVGTRVRIYSISTGAGCSEERQGDASIFPTSEGPGQQPGPPVPSQHEGGTHREGSSHQGTTFNVFPSPTLQSLPWDVTASTVRVRAALCCPEPRGNAGLTSPVGTQGSPAPQGHRDSPARPPAPPGGTNDKSNIIEKNPGLQRSVDALNLNQGGKSYARSSAAWGGGGLLGEAQTWESLQGVHGTNGYVQYGIASVHGRPPPRSGRQFGLYSQRSFVKGFLVHHKRLIQQVLRHLRLVLDLVRGLLELADLPYDV